MKIKFIALALACSLQTIFSSWVDGQEPTTKNRILAIAQKSVGYIDRDGTKWRKDKQCISCHRGALTVWSLNRAAERGISLNEEDLHDWNDWASDWNSFLAPDKREGANKGEVIQRENDAIAQLLLARSKHSNIEVLAEFRKGLAGSQAQDGSWRAGGQLPSQKRPKIETQQVTTMWSLVALADDSVPDDLETKSAFAKAMSWIGNAQSAKSTEWWAVRLLVEKYAGDENMRQTRQKLLSFQNDDGGWGWLHDDPSDALGTGIALYALASSGSQISEPFVVQAVEFLKSAQNKNGGWHVNGTKSNRAKKMNETASYWGTCWAVIGLLEFVEPLYTNPKPTTRGSHSKS